MATPGFSESTQNYISSATDMAYRERGIGDQQLQDLQGRAKQNYATADEVSAAAKGTGAMWGGQAKKALDMYNQQYMPAMQEQLDFARGYATPERKALNRGMAVSNVTQAGNSALAKANQTLASYGVRDPSGGRFAGQNRSANVANAGAAAGAGTMSDINTDMMGQQLLSGAINTGLQLPGQAATGSGVQLAAGNQQINAPLAATSTAAQTIGTPVQWYGLAGNELSEWQKAATSLAQNDLQQQALAQQAGNAGITGIGAGLGALNGLFGSSGMFGGGSSGGLFSGLGGLFSSSGGAAGGGMAANAGGALTTALVHKGGTIPGYAEGGAAIDTGMAPPGGAMVPQSASPSGGAEQDDVNAALEPGEFVVPERAARWYGEKFLQNLVAKADKEREEKTVAQPEMKRLPPTQQGMPPSFVSPGAGAIQTGAA